MSVYNVHFDHYSKSLEKQNLHPKMAPIVRSSPKQVEKLENIILHGPAGIGKYTQALNIVKQYSPSQLKYEKKMIVTAGKSTYCIKISDIHFEIDMSLLGCNAKTLWHSIYAQILDVLFSRPQKHGIILCKYFHKVHSELLECFYGYMQTDISSPARLHFVLLTEHVSFLPNMVLDRCLCVPLARPTRAAYNKVLTTKLDKGQKLSTITNIKDIGVKLDYANVAFDRICNKLIDHIVDIDELNFGKLRDTIYDLFIYDFDVQSCMFHIIKRLIEKEHIAADKLNSIFTELYTFLKYYNNNYRPIYHLERMCAYLITLVHGI